MWQCSYRARLKVDAEQVRPRRAISGDGGAGPDGHPNEGSNPILPAKPARIIPPHQFSARLAKFGDFPALAPTSIPPPIPPNRAHVSRRFECFLLFSFRRRAAPALGISSTFAHRIPADPADSAPAPLSPRLDRTVELARRLFAFEYFRAGNRFRLLAHVLDRREGLKRRSLLRASADN